MNKILRTIQSKKIVFYLALCILTCMSFYYNAVSHGATLSLSYKLSIVTYALFFPLVMYLIQKHKTTILKNDRIVSIVFSLMISQFVLIGASYTLCNNLDMCIGDMMAIANWLFSSMTITYIAYHIVCPFVSFLQTASCTDQSSTSFNIKKWLIILVAIKIAVLVLFYPSIFDFDSINALRSLMDPDEVKCNMNPFFVQLIHGGAFSLGKLIGSVSFGFALLSLISIAISTWIIWHLVKMLIVVGVNTRYLKYIAYIYAFFPLFPVESINVTKDGLFMYMFMFYIMTIFEIAITHGTILKQHRFLLLHSLSMLLLCLTRSQGVYIVIPQFILMLFVYRKFWKHTMTACIPPVVLYLAFVNYLLPSLDIEPISKRETYGTLFQQTARYLNEYPNDITDSERKCIDAILGAEKIRMCYDPDFVDPVKTNYKYNVGYVSPEDNLCHYRHVDRTNESKEISEYLTAWKSMGLRHPMCYVDAVLLVTKGFFYNTGTPLIFFDSSWYTSQACSPEYAFNPSRYALDKVPSAVCIFAGIPVVNFFTTIPYYNWIALLFIILLVYRLELDGVVLAFPVLLSIGVLIICPVVVGRYAFPIISVLPTIFIYILITNKNEKNSRSYSLL